MQNARIRINCTANFFTSSEVLYTMGNNGARTIKIIPMISPEQTENAISFVSVSLASSCFPAPRSWPTIIETALPIAR